MFIPSSIVTDSDRTNQTNFICCSSFLKAVTISFWLKSETQHLKSKEYNFCEMSFIRVYSLKCQLLWEQDVLQPTPAAHGSSFSIKAPTHLIVPRLLQQPTPILLSQHKRGPKLIWQTPAARSRFDALLLWISIGCRAPESERSHRLTPTESQMAMGQEYQVPQEALLVKGKIDQNLWSLLVFFSTHSHIQCTPL